MSDGTVACTRPPAGWACSRDDGHEGPCVALAAVPALLATAQSADVAAEATLILVAHQRYDIKGCLCGWAELGKSHAKHQVAMLAAAGLLTETLVAHDE